MEYNREPTNKLTHPCLICEKQGKNTQWRKHSLLNKLYWKEDFLTPHSKINSKWIKDQNVRSETILTPIREHKQNTLRYNCSSIY